MARNSTSGLTLSIQILEMQNPIDLKKDQNLMCKIRILTNRGDWELTKSFKEIEVFHANLVINEQQRGVALPNLPSRKMGVFQGSAEEYVKLKTEQYYNYLNSIFRRTILLVSKDVQEFGQFPSDVKKAVQNIAQYENTPLRSGEMKKEGEKFKAYRNRYFVLFPNYLLQYYESKDAYQIGISPKGCIDLTLARSLLIYQGNETLEYAFGIKTSKRTWKLMCDNEIDKNEWVSTLKRLLEAGGNGFVPEHITKNQKNVAAQSVQPIPIENKQINKSESSQEQKQATNGRSAVHLENLQHELEELQYTADVEKDKIRSELSENLQKQLEMQQNKILQFKQQIELITAEMKQLETKRNELDKEHDKKLSHLQNENERLADELENTAQRYEAQLTLKMGIIEELESRNEKQKQELEERKDLSYCMEGELLKFIGDTEANLKLKKQPQKKRVIFTANSKYIMWFDAPDKGKMMLVHKIDTNNESVKNTIGKEYPHWFKVIGDDRIALFVANDEQTKNRWLSILEKQL